jgi:transcriptional/translational regulatory protein YebC/TACO1
VLRLVDALEEDDDVQNVYANFDIPEQMLEAVAS